MSGVKRLIEDVMVLWEEGMPIAKIAELLQVSRNTVEEILEEHSNFYS